MLGRHNITVYADEAERCIGGIKQLAANAEWTDTERAYWTGVTNTLLLLLSSTLPDNYQAFIAAMQLHFTGEVPGETIKLEEGE